MYYIRCVYEMSLCIVYAHSTLHSERARELRWVQVLKYFIDCYIDVYCSRMDEDEKRSMLWWWLCRWRVKSKYQFQLSAVVIVKKFGFYSHYNEYEPTNFLWACHNVWKSFECELRDTRVAEVKAMSSHPVYNIRNMQKEESCNHSYNL